jgi:hypothetical protein
MTPEQFLRSQAARYAIDQGFYHGGVDNMTAILHVLCNRVNAGWLGGDWMAVLEDAPTKTGTVVEPMTTIDLRDMALRMFLSRVEDIMLGRDGDMVAGALYYCELHNVHREWFKDRILKDPKNHPRVATVGQVAFFK